MTLSESFLNYLAISILNTFQYLERNKIIHMDIKPQNIEVPLVGRQYKKKIKAKDVSKIIIFI